MGVINWSYQRYWMDATVISDLKGKVFTEPWFNDLLSDRHIDISPNWWTTDQDGLSWLKDRFIPLTNSWITGDYRLLILDGHGSHLTP